jgi:ribosome maturation factor RimP
MGVAEDIEQNLDPVLKEAGVELVAVQYQREPVGWVLRFFLDKEGGVSLDDCAFWSDRLGTLVEERGLATGEYSLEVSSPGLQRPLRKREDFLRFTGLEAIVKTFAPINNQRNFHGVLRGVENDDLILTDRTNGLVKVPLKDIASAKLDPAVGA